MRTPTFIKYYAPWCQHCQEIAKVYKQLSDDVSDIFVIGEVDC